MCAGVPALSRIEENMWAPAPHLDPLTELLGTGWTGVTPLP